MYCSKCGMQIDDGLSVCPHCNQNPNIESGVTETPAPQGEKHVPNFSPERKTVLAFAILTQIFTAYLPILGLIFSIVTFKKANRELAKYPPDPYKDWMLIAGRIVGKVCIFVSIGMTIFWSIYIIVIIASVAAGAGGYHNYGGNSYPF